MSSIHVSIRKFILPLEKIDEAIPKSGQVIELGCGEGIIAQYLAQNIKRKTTGVDLNKKRLPRKKVNNLKFINADIRTYKLNKPVGIVISDVLHHINREDQKVLIKKVYQNLQKGGVLVIKEIDTSEYFRAKLSRLWDFLLYPQDKIAYWNNKELKAFLNKLGFKVKLERTNRIFPGSTNLFIAVK